MKIYRLFFSLCLFCLPFKAWADDSLLCLKEAARLEKRERIQTNLLSAIALAESGRYSKKYPSGIFGSCMSSSLPDLTLDRINTACSIPGTLISEINITSPLNFIIFFTRNGNSINNPFYHLLCHIRPYGQGNCCQITVK